MKHTLVMASALLALAACGTPPTDAVADAASQALVPAALSGSGSPPRLTFTGLEDGKGAASPVACKLTYTLENRSASALKYVTVLLRPVPDPGDVNATSFIEARGDLALSMANIDAGTSRDSYSRFETMSCDRVKAIRIASYNCGYKPEGSCNDLLEIENATSVELVKP